MVSFYISDDVAGDPLLDENGQPLPPVPVDGDGSFESENMPVGVDFTVCVDEGQDGILKT